MALIRLTKIFEFEMAHALKGYDGPCRNIHGHSYKLHVTVAGEPVQNNADPKNGMLIDFSLLKEIVKRNVVDVFDHAIVLNEMADAPAGKHDGMFDRMVRLPFQPTCENLLVYIADKISRELPAKIQLHNLRLYETATSFAEWYAADNP
ncbi:MAG: 6-carboxytetrahydropterin synthase [Bacteroidetes bacterium]|nr:6-carboxytetrahydropterin synthase [Bacteroidota bacterium]MBU1717613.1 6-carboxytetrahydropterin synthase [Bacteroidota bacterium]